MSATTVFIDVDGTLWNDKSVVSFYRLYLDEKHPDGADAAWERFNAEVAAAMRRGLTREQLNAWFYEDYFRGMRIEDVREVAALWWERQMQRSDFWLVNMLERVRAHVAAGHDCVLVTGSFRELVQPLCARLGLAHALCAPLEEQAEVYTGRQTGHPMIGVGKRDAVLAYLAATGRSADCAHGYGDDDSDFPFLEQLRHPTVVAPEVSAPAQAARARGWAVLTPQLGVDGLRGAALSPAAA